MISQTIRKNDILIELMSMNFKTVQIPYLEKLLPQLMKNQTAVFSNHDVYNIVFNGEKVDLKKKGYYPKYRQIQYLTEHLRNIELLDCEDVEARGCGIRLYCTLNRNHQYWIEDEDNRSIFLKLHELRNLVTKARNFRAVDREKAFKRYVAMYFSGNMQ